MSHSGAAPDLAPTTAVPLARGVVMGGLRQAAIDVWGDEGLKMIGAALPTAVRASTFEQFVIPLSWYPETHVTAWFEAAYEHPAARREKDFCTYLDRMMDYGFGRIRKALLRLASPGLVLSQAPRLWRHDHSHGHVEVVMHDAAAELSLRDHVYAADPISRIALAEIYRYGVSLTGVPRVTATHEVDRSGALVVSLRWRAATPAGT
jgi:hypothetical protein